MPRSTKKAPKRPKHVVAHARLLSTQKPHYFELVLWDDHAAMVRKLKQPKNVQAVTLAEWELPSIEYPQPRAFDRLGQIHFCRGHWDVEIVVHEITHAILHRGRLLPPMLGQVMVTKQDDEEHLAYEAGEWAAMTLEWLLDNDAGHDPIVRHMRRKPAEIICNAK